MSKKRKQKNSKQTLAKVLLATALVKLITKVIELIRALVE